MQIFEEGGITYLAMTPAESHRMWSHINTSFADGSLDEGKGSGFWPRIERGLARILGISNAKREEVRRR